MRIQNSYAAAVAAAVAAVVFSAAFQPASAGIVTIDSFGGPSTDTASSSGIGSSITLLAVPQTIPGVFDTRQFDAQFTQRLGTGRTAAVFSGTAVVNSGTGTFSTNKAALTAGSSYDTLRSFASVSWANNDSSPVSLLGDGVGGFNDAIEVVVPSFTQSGGSSASYTSFLIFTDGTNSVSVSGPPTIGTWLIPFSSFVGGSINWGSIVAGYFDLTVSSGAFNGAIINELKIDSIRAVPEPTQMVSVAAAGAAYGAWRLRKLRRSREAAGDAIAS
jgi:hypothetical protein